MRTVVKIPRILKINRIEGLTISVVFNNGESRIIDFGHLLKNIDIPKDSNAHILNDLKEFKKVKLENHTLSWERAGQTIQFKGRQRRLPFEVGADILYKHSKKDKEAPILQIGKQLRELREEIGISQLILAQRSGTTRNYISRIENDRSGIELSTLQKIVESGLGKRIRIIIK